MSNLPFPVKWCHVTVGLTDRAQIAMKTVLVLNDKPYDDTTEYHVIIALRTLGERLWRAHRACADLKESEVLPGTIGRRIESAGLEDDLQAIVVACTALRKATHATSQTSAHAHVDVAATALGRLVRIYPRNAAAGLSL